MKPALKKKSGQEPMSALVLIVHVLDYCQQGICLPEAESAWPRAELNKVLNLSGIMGPLTTYSYPQLIQLLVNHLNVQSPLVYALYTAERGLLLDSNGVVVRDQLWYEGLSTRWLRVESSAAATDCRQLWQRFAQHQQRPPAATTAHGGSSRAELEQQLRIQALERDIAKLQKQLQDSQGVRLEKEFQEAHQVIRALQEQLQQARQQTSALSEQNAALLREQQVQQARVLSTQTQLQQLRAELAQRSRSPAEVEELVREIQICQEKLRAYEARPGKF